MPYSTKDDLLTGNVPMPAFATPERYVQDASDEVDSVIGFIYKTPVDMTEGGPVGRSSRLLLKRIANFLASGRLLMAASAGNQKQEINAYAMHLITEAKNALNLIASGDVILEGAERNDTEDPSTQFTGPQIYNKDPESNVEAFYDRIANPAYTFPWPLGAHPDRLVQ